ncbi:MAG TPA: hypothetical protein VMG38_17780 [Trebonia sp.]|nr:hypothetical protein [Trebonia sp.]
MADFSLTRTVDALGLSHNLPTQMSSFIGREAELAAVRALVAGSRLVTLTGAGGVGKTRLGLQVAAGLLDGSGDGVWFTDLAPLGIDGERVYQVPSMGVPADDADVAAVRASEAVRLLADRAAAQGVTLAGDEDGAQLAARICRRLDGIALALELAAARLRVMSAQELEARLDERFALLTGGSRAGLPRQQTLRAMVDWSWGLLSGAERAVLARLSVFAGGFGLAAAEAVAAGPDVPAAEVPALLDAPASQRASLPRARALVAVAHLLEHTGGYAIAASYCQEALVLAHAAADDHLVAELLYQQAWLLLRHGQAGAALPLVERGLDLVRPARQPRLNARLLAARAYARDAEGDHQGATRDAAESLRLFRQAGDRLQAGRMLGNLGTVELSAGDLPAARSHLAEALDIARTFNDRSGVVFEAFSLGLAEYLGGSREAARALFEESHDLARRARMRGQTALALLGLALTRQDSADQAWSARLHGAAEQALADLGHALEPLEARLADQDRKRLRGRWRC